MRKTKKIMSLALASAMVVSLAACGSSDSADTTAATTAAESTETTAAERRCGSRKH